MPLIKRMFSVGPQRHTQTLLEAYKLERELSQRISALKKYEPGKPSANSKMYKELLNDPYMQDVLALDKALAAEFDKLRKISEMETMLWGEYQKNKTDVEKGNTLKKLRMEREKISKNIISRVEGMDLDYMVPRHAVLPFSKTELGLLQFKRPDEPMSKENIKERNRTKNEIIQGIK